MYVCIMLWIVIAKAKKIHLQGQRYPSLMFNLSWMQSLILEMSVSNAHSSSNAIPYVRNSRLLCNPRQINPSLMSAYYCERRNVRLIVTKAEKSVCGGIKGKKNLSLMSAYYYNSRKPPTLFAYYCKGRKIRL